ncbi:MAG: MYG1 family protein [Verrucomicrobiota bacterium]
MLQSIITHPGGAHKDEFLACAVLLSQAPVAIERRNPTEADLDDPTVAIVDIGGQHQPEKNNFDNHQFPREMVPTCALSLVLKHLEIYEDAREFCSWLEVAEWFDCRGPQDTADWLGIDPDTISKLNSPLDITILRRFGGKTHHAPGEPLWEIMQMIGQDLVDHITNLRARLDFIAQQAEIWTVESGTHTFKALFMPRTDPLPEDPSNGLGYHIERLGLEEEIFALVYPDSRGSGYGMRRFKDNPRMEFTRLENEADVHFTHNRGFIAKTSATDSERIKTLLGKAFSC